MIIIMRETLGLLQEGKYEYFNHCFKDRCAHFDICIFHSQLIDFEPSLFIYFFIFITFGDMPGECNIELTKN